MKKQLLILSFCCTFLGVASLNALVGGANAALGTAIAVNADESLIGFLLANVKQDDNGLPKLTRKVKAALAGKYMNGQFSDAKLRALVAKGQALGGAGFSWRGSPDLAGKVNQVGGLMIKAFGRSTDANALVTTKSADVKKQVDDIRVYVKDNFPS